MAEASRETPRHHPTIDALEPNHVRGDDKVRASRPVLASASRSASASANDAGRPDGPSIEPMINPQNDAVTVVSVTYESSAVVPALTTTLRRFRHVVIVDNASRDDTVAQLRQHVPHANVIRSAANRGFGTGNNIGMERVGTDFALLLNPDCEIDDADVAQLMVTAERYPNAAIIAPQGYYRNNRLQESHRRAFFRPRCSGPTQLPDAVCSAEWLNGCCMLVRVEAFRAIGGFDQGFLLYYEEDDLCLRAIAAGYDCLLDPAARVTHGGGVSSKPSTRGTLFKHYHYARSRHRISRKYLGGCSAMKYRLQIAMVSPAAVLLHALRRDRAAAMRWLGWGSFAWQFWR